MTTKRSALTRRLLEGLTDEQWRVLRTARANVLFMGRGVSAKRVVESLRSQISDPIQVWHPAAAARSRYFLRRAVLSTERSLLSGQSVPHRRRVRARVREKSHGEHTNPRGTTAIRWKVAQERLVLGRVGRLEIKFCFNCERTGDDALGNVRPSARKVLNQGNLKDDVPDRLRAGV